MTGRLSGFDAEDLAAALLTLDDYRVVQAHARQTTRYEQGRVRTEKKHDLLMGRFDILAFGSKHCLRVQVFRGDQLSEKLVQASGPTPPYCVDEVWQWAKDNSGFARWWQAQDGWKQKDPLRVEAPRRVLARADTSIDAEVTP